MREAVGSLEGIGVSTFGMLDRMLCPFYERDLAAGRVTQDEAYQFVCAFLALTDVKFDIGRDFSDGHGPDHVETSTTVFIGGCDAEGTPVFNAVTEMIIRAYTELRLLNPKFHARISPGHPDEYIKLLGACASARTNVLAFFNDDVLVEANVREGKRIEDARLYVGGGCQENILQNTEINSRATVFFSLLQPFQMGVFPEEWESFAEHEGVAVRPFAECATFDAVYDAYLANLRSVVTRLLEHRNVGEAQGSAINPCPMHSATLCDCIANARDVTAGGARYSFGSVDGAGMGTLIDSLFAVKHLVFDESRIPLAQLQDVLSNNFRDEEALRQYALNRIPKFGSGNEDIKQFSARVFRDVAAALSGMPNTGGGRYVASLFAHRSFTRFGRTSGATPDGRKAGDLFSPGLGPSLESLGASSNVGGILAAFEPIDLADYPVLGVLDLKLPATPLQADATIMASVIRRFLDVGGQVLQINVVDPETLLDAKRHPERHRDLVVRISGYSAYFTALPPDVQEEVINRTLAVA